VKRLRYTAQALQDFQDIHDYIAQDNIDAASDFIERLNERCNELCAMPGIGRKRDDIEPGMRSSAVSEHLIFYRVLDEILEVVHVLHGRRNLEKVFETE
jgi:toxin ParE1/3/4